MRRVVIDANVIVSFFIDGNARQREAADALLQLAEESEIEAILPQFVVFEIAYVLQSQYGATGARLAAMIHDIVTFPGILVVDDCPWPCVLELWPRPLASLADAAIVAVATTRREHAVATFDQKLAKRLNELGTTAYW